MKQHISVEQLRELTDEQKNKLMQLLFKPEKNTYSEYKINMGYVSDAMVAEECTIGRCIELLTGMVKYMGVFDYSFIDFSWDTEEGELIDALFQAVKSIL